LLFKKGYAKIGYLLMGKSDIHPPSEVVAAIITQLRQQKFS
jgi:hypothetical protein